MAEQSAIQDVPHRFSLYWGFGNPLEVADDRRLLADMANLKMRSRAEPAEPDAAMIRNGSVSPPKGGPSSPPRQWALPHSPSGPRTDSQPFRGARPGTAPAGGRTPQTLGGFRRLEEAPPSTAGGAHVPSLTPQQAERVKRMQKLARNRAQGARELEARWKKADEVVAARRAGVQADAQSRVVQWADKRERGVKSVTTMSIARTHALEECLRVKERRTQLRKEEVAEAARQRQVEMQSQRAHAVARFKQHVRERDQRLSEAEVRVASRAGAANELKRHSTNLAREQAVRKDAAVMEALKRVDREAALKTARVQRDLVRKARQVQALREEQAALRSPRGFQVPMRPPTPTDLTSSQLPDGGGSSPRASQRASARPNSARSERPKMHAGALGLDKVMERCALCEREYDNLTGVTYLKRVAEQRAKFGDDEMLRRCERRGVQKMYESAGLCVFCCQFFQEGWKADA